MKNLIIISIFVLFSSCTKQNAIRVSNKIMPLGASRVEGSKDNHYSYRGELINKLSIDNINFKFVGNKKDDNGFHQGVCGQTSEMILNNIENWIGNVNGVDYVLFSTPGGNDASLGVPYDEILNNIKGIISIIKESNPNTIIILEIPAHGKPFFMRSSSVSNYFNNIKNDIIDISEKDHNIFCIDMNDGFKESFLSDNVHYNKKGAKFIADRYYNLLKTKLK